MAGAGVKNWNFQDTLAAADVNTYLMQQSVMVFGGTAARDAALGTATTPTVAEGMLVYLTDINQYQMNLDGTMTGWYPIAGQMPYAELTKTTTQSIGSGAWAVVSGFTQTIMRGSMTESSGGVTVPLAGRYAITAQITWSGASSAGGRYLSMAIDNTVNPYIVGQYMAGSFPHSSASWNIYLNAGQVVRIMAYQSSGAALNLDPTTWLGGIKFTVTYVGP